MIVEEKESSQGKPQSASHDFNGSREESSDTETVNVGDGDPAALRRSSSYQSQSNSQVLSFAAD